MRSLDDSPHRLQIDVPAAISHIMSVAHLVSELRTFAAYFTNSGHFEKLLIASTGKRSSASTYDSKPALLRAKTWIRSAVSMSRTQSQGIMAEAPSSHEIPPYRHHSVGCDL